MPAAVHGSPKAVSYLDVLYSAKFLRRTIFMDCEISNILWKQFLQIEEILLGTHSKIKIVALNFRSSGQSAKTVKIIGLENLALYSSFIQVMATH